VQGAASTRRVDKGLILIKRRSNEWERYYGRDRHVCRDHTARHADRGAVGASGDVGRAQKQNLTLVGGEPLSFAFFVAV